jgi:hypothetical protein
MERYGWRISSEFGRDFRVSGQNLRCHTLAMPLSSGTWRGHQCARERTTQSADAAVETKTPFSNHVPKALILNVRAGTDENAVFVLPSRTHEMQLRKSGSWSVAESAIQIRHGNEVIGPVYDKRTFDKLGERSGQVGRPSPGSRGRQTQGAR